VRCSKKKTKKNKLKNKQNQHQHHYEKSGVINHPIVSLANTSFAHAY